MVNITMKQPYGVTAGIIPWNATSIQFCTKMSAALAAGNAIIIKVCLAISAIKVDDGL